MLEVIVVTLLEEEPTTETVVMGNGPEVRLAKTRVREGVTENPHLATLLSFAGFNLCSANQCGCPGIITPSGCSLNLMFERGFGELTFVFI